jgi:pimeloyl-ACP methyl ester carboxylesterase
MTPAERSLTVDGVVLVHGGLHCAAGWDPLLPHLSTAVVAVDLPGRGRRPADLASVTLDDCVRAVIDSADESGFERFVLVGHSLGGVTITETAYRHPDRVAHLVYVGALVPPPGSTAAIVMTGSDLPPGPMAPMDEARAKALFGNDLSDEQWAEHWKTVVPDAAGIMNARLTGYPTGTPITYVGMTADVPVPPALADQMVANLGPRVDRRTIDAGHTVMLGKPAELAAIIEEVVAGIAAKA